MTQISKTTLMSIFLASCLRTRIRAQFIKQNFLDRPSSLSEGYRELKQLDTNVLEEVVAADFIFYNV